MYWTKQSFEDYQIMTEMILQGFERKQGERGWNYSTKEEFLGDIIVTYFTSKIETVKIVFDTTSRIIIRTDLSRGDIKTINELMEGLK